MYVKMSMPKSASLLTKKASWCYQMLNIRILNHSEWPRHSCIQTNLPICVPRLQTWIFWKNILIEYRPLCTIPAMPLTRSSKKTRSHASPPIARTPRLCFLPWSIPWCILVGWSFQMSKLDFIGCFGWQHIERKFYFQEFTIFLPIHLKKHRRRCLYWVQFNHTLKQFLKIF